jgi:hypothetical protein
MSSTSHAHDPDRAVWPALVVAPLVALGHLSAAYALVTPACGWQSGGVLHALSALSLVIVLAMTVVAWRAWRRAVSVLPASERPVTASDGIQAGRRASFLALVGTLVGAFSSLVIVAMWIPVGVVPACTA